MRHLIGDDANDMSGFGEVAEVHEGPDGNLYEWVEGLSAWGEPVGYWQGLSEVPVQPLAPQPAALGALYLASDGSLYQMHGLGEEEPEAEAGGNAEESPADDGDDAKPKVKMGPGRPGEIRVGPDGKRYRWVMGMGPGGKRTGFWRRLHPRIRRPAPRGGGRPAAAAARRPGARPAAGGGRKRKPFLKRLLPFAKAAASLIPIPGAGAIVRGGLTLADKAFAKKRVAGVEGLGALYQAPDGSLYQVQGIDEEELNGFAEGDAIDGFSANADLDGLARDEMEGIEDGSDIDGWGEPPAPPIEGDDALEGYVREPQRTTLQAYVPDKPAQTRAFDPTREPPDNWKPLW